MLGRPLAKGIPCNHFTAFPHSKRIVAHRTDTAGSGSTRAVNSSHPTSVKRIGHWAVSWCPFDWTNPTEKKKIKAMAWRKSGYRRRWWPEFLDIMENDLHNLQRLAFLHREKSHYFFFP